jgi:5-amino-6-(5-phosphoribosylamino)uracil reductase
MVEVPPEADDPYRDLVLGGPTFDDARERPWVALCAVTSVDGVTAVDGSSRAIGGAGDLRAMLRIRRGADAVLVGAATVRAEGYDAAMTRSEDVAWRVEHGLTERAALVIVSRTLELGDLGGGIRDTHVIVLTTTDPDAPVRDLSELAARLAVNGSRLEVLDVGGDDPGRISWPRALTALRDAGLRRVSCEGGPSVNAQLLAQGVVDEAFLTIAPRILGGGPSTLTGFAGADPLPVPMRLRSAVSVGDELLVRYEVPPIG